MTKYKIIEVGPSNGAGGGAEPDIEERAGYEGRRTKISLITKNYQISLIKGQICI